MPNGVIRTGDRPTSSDDLRCHHVFLENIWVENAGDGTAFAVGSRGHGLVVLERRSNAAEDSMGEITQCRITYGHGP